MRKTVSSLVTSNYGDQIDRNLFAIRSMLSSSLVRCNHLCLEEMSELIGLTGFSHTWKHVST